MMKTDQHLLERRIADTLVNVHVASVDVTELIDETETAITEAIATAEAEKAKALDPALSPDPKAALEATQVAQFSAQRLQVLLPRLRACHESALAKEYATKWDSEYHAAKAARDEAATKFGCVGELIAELVEAFEAANAADKLIEAVNLSAPTGERRRLLSTELHARNLQSFSRGQPPLMSELRLVDWEQSGRQVWPPVQQIDIDLVAPREPYNERYTGNWWKAGEAARIEQARRDQEALVEAERARKTFYAGRT
jgi:hypothetical protein